ncbi:MAG TPA: hypothetical protein VLE73_02135 [Candidatus Saccharimonadales bacterium]|nr:hypothetical protein [Candidatus Saccharimonadales bacterium]
MVQSIDHRPELTQAVLGIPYKLDGRPWEEILRDAEPVAFVGRRGSGVHAGVSRLLVHMNVTSPHTPLDDAPRLREQLLAHDPLKLRRLGRHLIQMHNTTRLTGHGYVRRGQEGDPVFDLVAATELVASSEDPDSALTHIRIAGYFGGTRPLPHSVMRFRKVFTDAAEYLDLYPPARLPEPGELAVAELAVVKGMTYTGAVAALGTARGKTHPIVRQVPGEPDTEEECYRLEDVSDVLVGGGTPKPPRKSSRPRQAGSRVTTRSVVPIVAEASPQPKGMSVKELVAALRVQPQYVEGALAYVEYEGDRSDIPYDVVSRVGRMYLQQMREYQPDKAFGIAQIAAMVGARPRVVRAFLLESGRMNRGDLVDDVQFTGEQLDDIIEELRQKLV